MDNGNPNAIHPVFVYGTLMRFQRANHMLETGIYMGEAILPDYAMYHLGRYPGIKPCSGEQVTGELYRVDDATLRQMDEYEENGSLYHRTPVRVVVNGQEFDAEAYVYARDVADKPLLRRRWGSDL